MNTTHLDPIAVARIQVRRAASGAKTYYSYEQVPIRHLRRWWKLHKHLRFMRREDRQWR